MKIPKGQTHMQAFEWNALHDTDMREAVRRISSESIRPHRVANKPTDSTAIEMDYRGERVKPAKHPGGRPVGPKMPCGWCRKLLTASEMRKHFTDCPKRPKQ